MGHVHIRSRQDFSDRTVCTELLHTRRSNNSNRDDAFATKSHYLLGLCVRLLSRQHVLRSCCHCSYVVYIHPIVGYKTNICTLPQPGGPRTSVVVDGLKVALTLWRMVFCSISCNSRHTEKNEHGGPIQELRHLYLLWFHEAAFIFRGGPQEASRANHGRCSHVQGTARSCKPGRS